MEEIRRELQSQKESIDFDWGIDDISIANIKHDVDDGDVVPHDGDEEEDVLPNGDEVKGVPPDGDEEGNNVCVEDNQFFFFF